MGKRAEVSRWLAANPVKRVVVPAAAVLLGASGLFGGLNHVPLTDRVEQLEPGAEATVQPFELTFKAALAVAEIEDAVAPLTDGNHLMVVLVDAENLSGQALGSNLLMPVSRDKSFLSRNVVVLDDQLNPDRPAVYDADSNVAVSVLNPGLTYRLALVWEFGGPVPDRLPLGLAKLTLRGNTISPDVLEWQDPAEEATITLPVQDLTMEPR